MTTLRREIDRSKDLPSAGLFTPTGRFQMPEGVSLRKQ
jgi:hypothetical protein